MFVLIRVHNVLYIWFVYICTGHVHIDDLHPPVSSGDPSPKVNGGGSLRVTGGDPLSPTDNGTDLSPVDSDGDPLSPKDNGTDLSPVDSCGDLLSPTDSGGDPLSPVDSGGDPLSPTDSGGDLSPVDSGGDLLSPTDSGGDPLSPVDSDGDLLSPVDSGGDPLSPTDSGSDLSPVDSGGDPLSPTDSGGDLIPVDSGGDPLSPTDNGGDLSPVDSGSDLLSPTDNGGDLSPVHSGGDPLSPTYSGGDLSRVDSGGNVLSPTDGGCGSLPVSGSGVLSPTDSDGHLSAVDIGGDVLSPTNSGGDLSRVDSGGNVLSETDSGSGSPPVSVGNVLSPTDSSSDLSPVVTGGDVLSLTESGIGSLPVSVGDVVNPTDGGCGSLPVSGSGVLSPTDSGSDLGPADSGGDVLSPTGSGSGSLPVSVGDVLSPTDSGGDLSPADSGGDVLSPTGSGSGSLPVSVGIVLSPADSSGDLGPADSGGDVLSLTDSGSGSLPVSVGDVVNPTDGGCGSLRVSGSGVVRPTDPGGNLRPVVTGGNVLSLTDSGIGSLSVSVGDVVNPTDGGCGSLRVSGSVVQSPADSGGDLGPADSGGDVLSLTGSGSGSLPVSVGDVLSLSDSGGDLIPVDIGGDVLSPTDSGGDLSLVESVGDVLGSTDSGIGSLPVSGSGVLSPTDSDSHLIPVDIGGNVFSPTDSGTGSLPVSVGDVLSPADHSCGSLPVSSSGVLSPTDSGSDLSPVDSCGNVLSLVDSGSGSLPVIRGDHLRLAGSFGDLSPTDSLQHPVMNTGSVWQVEDSCDSDIIPFTDLSDMSRFLHNQRVSAGSSVVSSQGTSFGVGVQPAESDVVMVGGLHSDLSPPVHKETSDDVPQPVRDPSVKHLNQERGRPKLYVKWSSNSRGKRVFDKRHHCLYCSKASTNLSKHLLKKHRNEERIREVLTQTTGSRKRKLLLEYVRNLGDYKHNCAVMSKGEGEIIPWRSPPEPVDAMEYVPCPDCFAFFQQEHLWRHHRDCNFCEKSEKKHAFRSLRSEAQLLLPSSNEVSESLKENILKIMTGDEISILARNDSTITAYGEKLLQKHSNLKHLHSHISCKMRELARFVAAVRKIDSTITWLDDCLYPNKFDTVVDAVRKLCGFCEENNKYQNPSLALKLGHSLKKCGSIVICACLKEGNEERRKTLKNFIYLCDKEWSVEVSSSALSTLATSKMNKPQLIPLTEDIQKLHTYLSEESKKLLRALECSVDAVSWQALAKVTLVRTLLFNRRRAGEAERLLLTDYNQRNQDPVAGKDVADALSEIERIFCRTMSRVEIRGKRGRTVPLILTPEMVSAIDVLNNKRSAVGIREDNPYVFARLSVNTPFRAADCLHKFARQCGAECPENLTSTQLRKHIATTSQILNLQECDLDILAGHLGHDLHVHRNFYRLPHDTLQLAKVSKLLIAFDQGKVAAYKGKNLDEIDVNDIVELEEDEDEESLELDRNSSVPALQQQTRNEDTDVEPSSDPESEEVSTRANGPPAPRRLAELEGLDSNSSVPPQQQTLNVDTDVEPSSDPESEEVPTRVKGPPVKGPPAPRGLAELEGKF